MGVGCWPSFGAAGGLAFARLVCFGTRKFRVVILNGFQFLIILKRDSTGAPQLQYTPHLIYWSTQLLPHQNIGSWYPLFSMADGLAFAQLVCFGTWKFRMLSPNGLQGPITLRRYFTGVTHLNASFHLLAYSLIDPLKYWGFLSLIWHNKSNGFCTAYLFWHKKVSKGFPEWVLFHLCGQREHWENIEKMLREGWEKLREGWEKVEGRLREGRYFT